MRIADLITRPVVTCQVNDTLNLAAQRMWDEEIGALPVVREDGKLVGMITDRDVCMGAYTQGRRLDEILVNSAMSENIVCARADQKPSEVEQLMADHRVRRVPVVDADHKPIGLISIDDLAVESAQPDTRLRGGPAGVAHTLAAICRPRVVSKHA